MEQWIIDNHTNLYQILNLEENESRNDPENEPYKSLYESRTIINDLLTNLSENQATLHVDSQELDLYIACRTALLYRNASNFNSTEEKSEGVKIMEDILKELSSIPLIAKFCDLNNSSSILNEEMTFSLEEKNKLLLIIGFLQQTLNSLGFVYGHVWGASPDNSRKGINFLTNAQHLYNAFSHYFLSLQNQINNKDLPLQMISGENWIAPHFFQSLFNLNIKFSQKEGIPVKNEETGGDKGDNDGDNDNDGNGGGGGNNKNSENNEKEEEEKELVSFEKINENGDFSAVQRKHFQDNFTRTLFYLAQAYGKCSGLDSKENAAKYCYFTLHRQLNSMEYEPLEWALNAATLSQYYHNNNQYLCAKHCLCAAEVILSEAYEDPLVLEQFRTAQEDEQGNVSIEEEKWRQAWADIRRCWIKLGISLLIKSWQVIDGKLNEEIFGQKQIKESFINDFMPFNIVVTNVENKRIPFVKQSKLQVNNQQEGQAYFDDHLCLQTFDEARKVFLFIQRCIQEAQLFYRMDEQCSDAIMLIQDLSAAYKELAHFDLSLERQCCMHKRRVDMLRELLKQLNPQHWLLVVRQLLFELSETLHEMMSLKRTIYLEKPTPHLKSKINGLGEECIKSFQNFISSYKDNDGKLPDRYPENDERPVVVALFHIARIYTNLIVVDRQVRIDNHLNSLECYKFIVNYCDKFEDAKAKVAQEYEIAAEMCALLPAKMDSMRHAI